ncbi:MAG: PD40 domain-containing protein [Planctomycetes bacterium]|nr:PD40 domain-containing protein [Planctomycetota bacterium]
MSFTQEDGTTNYVSAHQSAISADGGVVAFVSAAQNLLASGGNGREQIYTWTRASGAIQRASATPSGVETDGRNHGPTLSGDGRFISFVSESDLRTGASTPFAFATWLKDRTTGEVWRVGDIWSSVRYTPYDRNPVVSRSGRYVAYSHLYDAPEHGHFRARRWDRLRNADVEVHANAFSEFAPWMSADGSRIVLLASTRDSAAIADLPTEPSAAMHARINFQPAAATVPAGYLADAGQVFAARGNGFSYGWRQANAYVVDRNDARSPDQRYDTLAGLNPANQPTMIWEIAVPNGEYAVFVACGDPTYPDYTTYALAVEGVQAVSGRTNIYARWLTGMVDVVVSDGRLTLTSGGYNGKICFLDIYRLSGTPPPSGFTADINFQPAASPAPTGYAVDSGLVFGARGNGLSYGWSGSLSALTRDRNSTRSPDQRYDTLILTQANGANGVWEIAVPNGRYQVRVVGGDPSFYDANFRLNVEGTLALSGTVSSASPWREATVQVQVGDGRLTLNNGAGSVNSKLSFIEIDQLP